MTDDEIIKALNECSERAITFCKPEFARSVLAFINRQKAEIAEYPLKTLVGNNCMICSKTGKDYDNLIAEIKAEYR